MSTIKALERLSGSVASSFEVAADSTFRMLRLSRKLGEAARVSEEEMIKARDAMTGDFTNIIPLAEIASHGFQQANPNATPGELRAIEIGVVLGAVNAIAILQPEEHDA